MVNLVLFICFTCIAKLVCGKKDSESKVLHEESELKDQISMNSNEESMV